MCGIAGVVNLYSDEQTEKLMLSTMKRRGPDSLGIYREGGCCLLHSRLAIIDPSGGSQPMTLSMYGKRYTIVYNGELYNTVELRGELIHFGHRFSGHSDTEVVLHAYVQWGEAALDKMNGIYAFAIWESTENMLFLARDRIGVKPLFYQQEGKGLVFASEIKTILAHPKIRPIVDCKGISQLILLGPGRIAGSGVFRDIFEVKPGHCCTYQDGKFQQRQYWHLTDREHEESFENTAEMVRYLVTDAVERQMVSDMPIGTFLSGGLDSSIITAICANKMHADNETLSTFSVDYLDNDKFFEANRFQPNSDNEYISIMVDAFHTSHNRTLLDAQNLYDSLDAATEARDLPGMADVDASLLAFCKEIRSHVKVALSGECADEIFGGYPWYRDPNIRDTEGFPWAQNTQLRECLLPEWLRGQIDAGDYVHSLYDSTISAADILPGTDPLNRRMKQMTILNFNWFMQTLLDRKDRMSMYHSLEVRVPFCDHRIAEYLYAVPWEFKDYCSTEKGLLRYAFRDMLPDKIVHRKKSPYPKTMDPRYTQLIWERLRSVIQSPMQPIHQVISRKALDNITAADFTWPWYGQLMRKPQTLAYLLQINHWMDHYRVEIIA